MCLSIYLFIHLFNFSQHSYVLWFSVLNGPAPARRVRATRARHQPTNPSISPTHQPTTCLVTTTHCVLQRRPLSISRPTIPPSPVSPSDFQGGRPYPTLNLLAPRMLGPNPPITTVPAASSQQCQPPAANSKQPAANRQQPASSRQQSAASTQETAAIQSCIGSHP